MTSMHQTDILFDDVSILTRHLGRNEAMRSSPATDCDCISYSPATDHDEPDTDQVTATSGQAD